MNNAVVVDVARVGLAAVAFILVLKFVFVKLLPLPGLSDVVASI
jgi:hypothetical protein